MQKLVAIIAAALLSLPLFARGGEGDDGWSVGDIPARRQYSGYRFFIEGAYGMGATIDTHPFSFTLNKPLRYFQVGTVHGYSLGSVVFLGAGTSYLQLIGSAVDEEQPKRESVTFADIRLTFGNAFAFYIDMRPGLSIMIQRGPSWQFSAGLGFGLDIVRSFHLGLEINTLPLNIGTDRASQMDLLLGIHAGLSFGGGCRRF